MRPVYRFFFPHNARTPIPTTAKTSTSTSATKPTQHNTHAAPLKRRCSLARIIQKLPSHIANHLPACIKSHVVKCEDKLGEMCEGCRNDNLAREARRKEKQPECSPDAARSSPSIGVHGGPNRTTVSTSGSSSRAAGKAVALGTKVITPTPTPTPTPRDSMEILPIPRTAY